MSKRQPPLSVTTREWVDGVFSLKHAEGGYVAHEPVYGFGSRRSAPNQAPRLARTARILQILEAEPFDSLLDVGAGEAYTAHLIRGAFQVSVAACDLSREAALRGRELFGVPTFACDAARLPFEDRAFDCVLCSEVLEHLEDPFSALDELTRITRRCLVLTTSECCHFEWQRRLMCKLRDFSRPHLERNWWTFADFPRLLGREVKVMRQARERNAPSDRESDLEQVRKWLEWAIHPVGLDREGMGVIALWHADPPGAMPQPRPIDWADMWNTLLRGPAIGRPVRPEEESWLRDLLRCPDCLGRMVSQGDHSAHCPVCDTSWSARDGVIDFLSSEASGGRKAPSRLPEPAVKRLQRLFSPSHVWSSGWEIHAGRFLLGLAEFQRDLRIGMGMRESLRVLKRSWRTVLRDLNPRAEGRLVRAKGCDEIYRIEGGKRRHIADDQVFFDLGYVFDNVREVAPEWLDRFPEGEPIRAVGDS